MHPTSPHRAAPALPCYAPLSGTSLLVLPRARIPVVDVIGAADAFIGGFLAARCRRLSMCQAMLWAHGAGTLSTMERGAQEIRMVTRPLLAGLCLPPRPLLTPLYRPCPRLCSRPERSPRRLNAHATPMAALWCLPTLAAVSAGIDSAVDPQESMPGVGQLQAFLLGQMHGSSITAAALAMPHRDEPPVPARCGSPAAAATNATTNAAADAAADAATGADGSDSEKTPLAPPALCKATFLAQTSLHLAAMRLDFGAVLALARRRGAAAISRQLQARDAFGLTPTQRANECHELTRLPQYLEMVRMLLGARPTFEAEAVTTCTVRPRLQPHVLASTVHRAVTLCIRRAAYPRGVWPSTAIRRRRGRP